MSPLLIHARPADMACGHVRAGAAARGGKRSGWCDPRLGPEPELVHAHLHNTHALRLHRPPQVIPHVICPIPPEPQTCSLSAHALLGAGLFREANSLCIHCPPRVIPYVPLLALSPPLNPRLADPPCDVLILINTNACTPSPVHAFSA